MKWTPSRDALWRGKVRSRLHVSCTSAALALAGWRAEEGRVRSEPCCEERLTRLALKHPILSRIRR
jgi:hypothetical protein